MTDSAASRRTLLACSALSFAYFAAIGGFNPFAPLWYKELGLPVVAIGFLVSLASWTRLFAPYAWGALADRSGQRIKIIRYAALASFLAALGFLLPPPWQTVSTLAASTFLMFSFNAAIVPLTETLIAAQLMTPDGSMDARRYGQVRVWGSVGFLATVLIAGWWFEHFGMKAFAITTLVLLGAVVVMAWRLPQQQERPAHAHAPAPPVAKVLRRPEVRWFFAGVFLTVLAHTALYTFFSLFMDSMGYGKQIVGLLWAASVVVEIAWFALQGRMMERGSLHHWLIAAALLTALRFGLTGAFASSLSILVLAQCLHAITFAAQHTACIALVTRYFPGTLRGRGQALYSVLGYGCSGVLGSVAGAWLVSHTGYAAVFGVASLAALASALCCWRSLVWDRRNGTA
ncbi:MFS transporter [Paucibacter sp. Y2R2-4]|uniref:MFS transporter n=1 Tax=Paucibacter sp. Y2R2-4 TaxID=2893553 RepID=UPI0021E46B05|nr:MFS transporter [Paucibacter sp. Y2R2-4]MCV2348347.1 MFS transporter [Paucibacter sp. Y2R2-4]